LAGHATLLAGNFNHARHLGTDRIGECDVRHYSTAEKGIHAMPGPVEELVWNDELKRLMLFFQRTDSRDGNHALHPELLETMNVGPKIQFAGQTAVPAPVSRQKGYLATLKRTEHIGVRGRAERRLQLDF